MGYKINFINNSYRRFYRQHRVELRRAWERCMSAGDLILREDVTEFEDTLAKYTGTKHAIAVNSGTDALVLSVKALGIGPGDEVIVPSHTFIASIYAVVANGATPILIDVGSDELMSVDHLESLLDVNTKAIIPVHFHGKVCDMDKIMSFAERNDLLVIEDGAQALGSTYKGIPAGSMGDTGCFSFNTPKLMGGWGDGGGIVTNDSKLAERLYLMRNHWNMAQTSVRMADFPTPESVEWAGKSRMDNINAAMLNVKFKYYDQMLARRKDIADMYTQGLSDLPLTIPTYGEGDVVQEYIVRIGSDAERWDFADHMKEAGVEVLVRETTPNHKMKGLDLEHWDLPVTESISTDAVRLPAYPELTNEEVEYVIHSAREFYKI